jgi:hypothetical protein
LYHYKQFHIVYKQFHIVTMIKRDVGAQMSALQAQATANIDAELTRAQRQQAAE